MVLLVPPCGCLSQYASLVSAGVNDLQAALQLNFKPIVAAVVNVNNYEQRTNGKQLPVDQQGGDMGLHRLTQ